MSSTAKPIKRTYSRQSKTLNSTTTKKRTLDDEQPKQPSKRRKLSQPQPKQKKLTQLFLALSDTQQSSLRTCPQCSLSYTIGTPDDESLHRAHCARVQRGMEWGKEEEKANVETIEDAVKISDGRKGRIVCVPLSTASGKLATKMNTLLSTISLALSSPALTPEMLSKSKAYLFLLPSASREKIAGCVVAQRISTAFDIDLDTPSLTLQTIPHPTHLGISRLFVPSALRRQGIASLLLDAAAKTFVHGCPLDPTQGQAAFTQPTELGEKVMKKWGQGACRVYEE